MWSNMMERIASDVHPIAWGVVCVATLIAMITDVHSRRIHNVLTVPLFLAGLGWAIATNGLPGLGEGLAAAALLGFPFIVLFLFARGGAGDAKIMMALGPWLGLAGGALVLAAVAIAGILVAVFFAVYRGYVREAASNLGSIGLNMLFVFKRVVRLSEVPRVPSPDQMHRVPYGLAIWIGCWVSALGVLLCHTYA